MKKYSNIFINIFYVPLIFISLLGILENLLTQISNMSKWSAIFLNFLIFGIVFLYILKNIKVPILNGKIFNYLKTYNKMLIIIGLTCVVLWQLYLVLALSGFNIWDPGIIIYKAMKKPIWVKDYFSYNPNTLFLMFYEHWVWIAFNKPSIQHLTIILNLINLSIFDFSLVVLYKMLKEKISKIVLGFSVLLMGITPWYCIPYSDILAFALSVFTLYLLLSLHNKKSISRLIEIGSIFTIDYLVKPSLVIVFIAYFIVRAFLGGIKLNRSNVVRSLIIIITIFLELSLFNVYKFNNSIVEIDKNKALPMMHFADMGIQGKGGYYLPDVLHDYAIKDPDQRKKEDIMIWKERFEKMGILNYESFLIRKQVINTVDASFNWDKNDIFLKPYRKKNNFTKVAWQLFLKDSAKSGFCSPLMLFEEIVWASLFFFMLFNITDNSYFSQLLKYTVVGFFIFLLLFEGGTSRYIIQFLPYLLILGAKGLVKFFTQYKIDLG